MMLLASVFFESHGISVDVNRQHTRSHVFLLWGLKAGHQACQ